MNETIATPRPGLDVRAIHKSFDLGERTVEVLKGATLALGAADSVVLTGPSGSGKSTLLHIIGTLDDPTSGQVVIDGTDPVALPERELARFRNSTIGFVFQDSHLLPQYSVLENVLLPALAFPAADDDAARWGRELLDRVGLSSRLDHRPGELSGGEKQRAAVARALINRPRLLLCDEPTGSLDATTASLIADLLFQLHQDEDNMLVVVTHSERMAARLGRTLVLHQGRLADSAAGA